MNMAKDRKSTDKKSTAKSKKSSGKGSGSKLAKSVKKSGLMDLINSDLGREILADALVAAAAVLSRTRTAKKAGANAGAQGADLTQTAAGAVAGVVTEAARHFLPASLVGEETGAGKAAASEPKKVKYVQRSSDTSKRRTTKAKSAKSDTAE
jgi:hypothetical protein